MYGTAAGRHAGRAARQSPLRALQRAATRPRAFGGRTGPTDALSGPQGGSGSTPRRPTPAGHVRRGGPGSAHTRSGTPTADGHRGHEVGARALDRRQAWSRSSTGRRDVGGVRGRRGAERVRRRRAGRPVLDGAGGPRCGPAPPRPWRAVTGGEGHPVRWRLHRTAPTGEGGRPASARRAAEPRNAAGPRRELRRGPAACPLQGPAASSRVAGGRGSFFSRAAPAAGHRRRGDRRW